MDWCHLLLVLFVCSLIPCYIESLKLSKEEDLELERQLKLLNKPAVKTIKSHYGDIYDCVDFYKQPAFDHPLLKNFTFERREKLSSGFIQGISLPGGGCPLGTVPIRRITKKDLIREKLASKLRSFGANRDPTTLHAGAKTRAGKSYAGMSANLSIYNPKCVGQQYSAARIKITGGPDSIEAGWRVDRTFYGDNRVHFYIRTHAEVTHCLDTRCPGFIVTSASSFLGHAFVNISKPGGPIHDIRVNILTNPGSGQWNLEVGPRNMLVGIWPTNIFSKGGLIDLASFLEWGGEVFSPPGTPKPPMGAGNLPLDGSTKLSAYFSLMRESTTSGMKVPANNVEPFFDTIHYKVKDEGFIARDFGHLIIYGGPGGSTN